MLRRVSTPTPALRTLQDDRLGDARREKRSLRAHGRDLLIPFSGVSNIIANRFSAAGSAIGYLAQVEYALLIALERMDHEESLRLSLETVDDIVFENEDDSLELWQTKHHIGRRGSLGDASPDLWKSINNWIESTDDRSACFFVQHSDSGGCLRCEPASPGPHREGHSGSSIEARWRRWSSR